ncbi:MAG: hypothetical protein QXG08_02265, partial [Candidatus Methanomethyliaceae archaeon]
VVTLISFAIWGKNIIIPGVVALYAVVPGFIASTVVTLVLAFTTKPHSENLLKETLTGAFIKPSISEKH